MYTDLRSDLRTHQRPRIKKYCNKCVAANFVSKWVIVGCGISKPNHHHHHHHHQVYFMQLGPYHNIYIKNKEHR